MTSDSDAPLRGKTILLTGASGGIGLATARQLAGLGADLLLVCRDATRGERARQAVQLSGPATRVELLLCDLSRLTEVHQLAEQVLARYDRLDVLINNAGVLPNALQVTEEGHELCWATNHLAPFVLTNRLLPLLTAAPAGLILTVSSQAHWLGELETSAARRNDPALNSAFTAYCDSKLANILFTRALAERLELTPATACSLHPGLVRSQLFAGSSWLMRGLVWLARPFARSCEQAARGIVCLVNGGAKPRYSGQYFANCRPARSSSSAANLAEAHRLWRISADETGVGT
ncbi:SDR family NAD(P)-dependent oxidoreductase [Hymenobacter sp. B81]|uniref:SDR family NAD(P)-dependent oxidoreductase n=1 Tax=Hymenobacter sp. B81 TaxID=3344878 RepID=UPI0037DC70DB